MKLVVGRSTIFDSPFSIIQSVSLRKDWLLAFTISLLQNMGEGGTMTEDVSISFM